MQLNTIPNNVCCLRNWPPPVHAPRQTGRYPCARALASVSQPLTSSQANAKEPQGLRLSSSSGAAEQSRLRRRISGLSRAGVQCKPGVRERVLWRRRSTRREGAWSPALGHPGGLRAEPGVGLCLRDVQCGDLGAWRHRPVRPRRRPPLCGHRICAEAPADRQPAPLLLNLLNLSKREPLPLPGTGSRAARPPSGPGSPATATPGAPLLAFFLRRHFLFQSEQLSGACP